jgi:hypothetical protein
MPGATKIFKKVNLKGKFLEFFYKLNFLLKMNPFLCVEATPKWSTATSVKLQTKYIEFHSKAISFLISRLLMLFYADNHI